MEEPQPPRIGSYSDLERLAASTGIGDAKDGRPRRRLPGTYGNPVLIVLAGLAIMPSLGVLPVAVADAVRGRATIDAVTDAVRRTQGHRRAEVAVDRDYAEGPIVAQVRRLRGLVPPEARITALSLNSARRLAAFGVRGSRIEVYEADALRIVAAPWSDRGRASAQPVTLVDLDPRAPARIVRSVIEEPGFAADDVTSLTLSRAGGALHWVATTGYGHRAFFTADADGSHVRRLRQPVGATP